MTSFEKTSNDLSLDPRLAGAAGVTVQSAAPAPGESFWKLLVAKYDDRTDLAEPAGIVCSVEDEDGAALGGVNVVLGLPGDQLTAATDGHGRVEFAMLGGASYSPDRGEHGPYSVYVDGLPSDAVVGMGLPRGQTVRFELGWRRAATAQTTFSLPAVDESNAPVVTAPETAAKLFKHYVLFGPGAEPATLTFMILALDYIIRFAPLVGFSVAEAKNAEHVTVMADSDSISVSDEQELIDAGCQVTRLAAADSYAFERTIQEMLASGSPYPT